MSEDNLRAAGRMQAAAETMQSAASSMGDHLDRHRDQIAWHSDALDRNTESNNNLIAALNRHSEVLEKYLETSNRRNASLEVSLAGEDADPSPQKSVEFRDDPPPMFRQTIIWNQANVVTDTGHVRLLGSSKWVRQSHNIPVIEEEIIDDALPGSLEDKIIDAKNRLARKLWKRSQEIREERRFDPPLSRFTSRNEPSRRRPSMTGVEGPDHVAITLTNSVISKGYTVKDGMVTHDPSGAAIEVGTSIYDMADKLLLEEPLPAIRTMPYGGERPTVDEVCLWNHKDGDCKHINLCPGQLRFDPLNNQMVAYCALAESNQEKRRLTLHPNTPVHCHAGRDGECNFKQCPQLVEGNYKTMCPLSKPEEDE